MNILVIDHNQDVIKALVPALKAHDSTWECQAAVSVYEALVIAKGSRPDVVFVEIEMPEANGFRIAEALRTLSPSINLIFMTANADYALEAHRHFPSAFLLKPFGEKDVRLAMENLRHPVAATSKPHLECRCFGNFDAFVGGNPVAFKRSKTKELLAFLVDRNGARVTSDELVNTLWEDGVASVSRRAQVRNLISDLRGTLEGLGVGDVVVRSRDAIAILPNRIECDYYRYLRHELGAVNSFHGEYMTQYWWSETTLGSLL